MLPRPGLIDNWIFDLDNTLYPPSSDLFGLIDQRMGAYIADRLGVEPAEARTIQKRYFHDHGTTLAGLMAHHGVDPHEFLAFVHDIALDRLTPAGRLGELIAALPGSKFVFTNGDADYAARVLDRLGLAELFDAVHDIHLMGLIPKPDPRAYQGFVEAHGIDPARAAFVEDMARNLIPAKALGMTTVWVDNGSEAGGRGADPAAIDVRVTDITAWLEELVAAGEEEERA